MSIGDIADTMARVYMNPNATCEQCGAKQEDGKFIAYYVDHGVVCSDCAEAAWRTEGYVAIVTLGFCIIMPIILTIALVLNG